MTKIERIKLLQKIVGAEQDGVIGNETLSLFAKKYNKTKAQTAHFFGNIHHESLGFKIARENMSYSAARIMQIFGVGKHSAKVTQSESVKLAGKPYELAERVYGLGNPSKAVELGNKLPGDGYKFRGGGALQTTGGGAYLKHGGQLLHNNPDLIDSGEAYFLTAISEFDSSKIWDLAKDMTEASHRLVCRKVNGGYNGLPERISLSNMYFKMFI